MNLSQGDAAEEVNPEKDLDECAEIAAKWHKRPSEWCRSHMEEWHEAGIITYGGMREQGRMIAACMAAPNDVRPSTAAIFYIYALNEHSLKPMLANALITVFTMSSLILSTNIASMNLYIRSSASRRWPSGHGAKKPLLVTISPALMARLSPELPKAYLEGLLKLESMGAVVMVLSLKHQLSEEGYYWYNIPKSAGFPFLAVVEHTNYVPKEKFGGDHIVYVGDYLEPDHAYFKLSDAELLDLFAPHLKKFNPAFEKDWVKKIWVFKTAYAQPVPLVNHSENIPSIETPVEGLYFTLMSQVYPWDRGTNFAVEIGRRVARLMVGKQ